MKKKSNDMSADGRREFLHSALGLHHPQASEFAVAKYEGTR